MSLRLDVASVPDRDNVVVEIWNDDQQLAELVLEHCGLITIEIFENTSGKSWMFDCLDLQRILDLAVKRLRSATESS